MMMKRLLSTLAAGALALSVLGLATPAQATRSAAEAQPDANTVILDHFNGSTTGTAYGDVTYETGLPGLGQAARFGPNRFIQYSLPGWSGGGTIQMWIKPDSLGSYATEILSINWYNSPTRPTGGGNTFAMGTQAENPFGGPADAPLMGTLQTTADTALPVGQWTHLAVTWGPDGTRIYLDGVDRTLASLPGEPDLLPQNWLYLNSWGEVPMNINGLVDELLVSNVQRTPEQIAADAALRYDFTGFYAPISNPPAVNKAKAGSAVPVKFGLGSDEGLDVLAAMPSSQQIDCTTGQPVGDPVMAVSARKPVLTYDSSSDRYSFVWKTDKAWAGTCRQFLLPLNDGTTYRALFAF